MEKLAINGGNPIRDTYLAYGKQSVNEDDIKAVVEVLKGDYLTTGPYIKEFEDAVAKYVGAKYAVAVSSGTAALHMACAAAGIESGDEVIVSSMTFAASANAVLYCGGTPVFADIDPLTYNIDPAKMEEKITSRTKAIIPVDFTGQSVDMDEIKRIADKHHLIIIEDAAHALGSEYKGRKVGSQADMVEFSFHPVKPITTAEGGVITTNNKALYEKMMTFRTHGITKARERLTENHGPWYHEQQSLGYNYRLTDIQSALGTSQMSKIDSFISKRREIVKLYNEAFKSVSEIITPYEADFSNSGWHIYVIKVNPELLTVTRKEIFQALQAENIGVNVHYLPVYWHPYYKELGYEKGICPNAETLYENMITLPLFPSMTKEDTEDVIGAVKKVINYYRK
ncbi:UDP-4-amino-4,6-dideoxy-N-acetyl-beta-L-altrosamine transaminase [Isachenkonia alkalipeptolytica]|uniref:UDP-4-amino-4, 6-dideoxy-N-acetyl-beta-L-altrosamine transaminase n=1 Tax=Isachenkonia alkalipeptolytica TaxID=2565777 RepID=A0AA43XMP2_9CLOT|nr:UDP-4-amino-4,6-dideoxy-N-acetyl-beta-L-altrosamine transaminase [Isachenkonia alkalipeptolytica]NBG89530.1 UDP-4-amino-4,6-dideoxy-N-acetyl-beta-L-altrosamine transaminase [Isachenkonia alkalipeptolytica]